MPNVFELLIIARDFIDNDNGDIHDFKAELSRRDMVVDDSTIIMVWTQAWHDHVKKVRDSIKMLLHMLMEYRYNRYVGKEITEEEFDGILKDYGLMRIKSEEAE